MTPRSNRRPLVGLATALLVLASLAVGLPAANAAGAPPPASLIAEVRTDGNVRLLWSPVAGATEYAVYLPRRLDGRVTTVTGTEWTSSVLEPGVYKFGVTAVVAGRESRYRLVAAKVSAPTPPVQPPVLPAEPSSAPAPPSAPPPAIERPTRVWDYEDGSLVPQWAEIHNIRPDQARVVDRPVYPGTLRSAQFSVKPGDTGWGGTSGTLRSEVKSTVSSSGAPEDGDEQWWAWPVFFPADFDWDERGQFLIFTQWHATAGRGHPNIMLWSDVNERLSVDVRGGAGGAVPGDAEYDKRYTLDPIVKGAWNDFLVRVVWSADPSVGLVELWHDGMRVHAAQDATLYNSQSVYIKQGIYSASGTKRSHQLSFGPLRLGASRESVENLPPDS